MAFVMSGGTEGVLSPHVTVFSRRAAPDVAPPGQKRLALGIGFTRSFAAEEIGRAAQVRETAAAVQQAMADASIENTVDLHFVQIKCPLLTSAAIADARARGRTIVTADTYESMGYSRGASALGVALACREMDEATVADDAALAELLLRDWSVASSVASTSAGIELDRNVVIVMGMSRASASPYVIGHDVMRDAIDGMALQRVLRQLDIDPAQAAQRIVNVFAKARPHRTARYAARATPC